MANRKTILVAEDNEMEVLLLKRSFVKAGVNDRIIFVIDGEQAIDYLNGRGIFADRTAYPLPDLVLLDIKMPKVDGFDVLIWLRKESAFDCVPVVMFTSSDEPRDVRRAYELRANSYVKKSLAAEDGTESLELLHRYWREVNICPRRI
jgi:CheY-like chemotaxis protein